MPDLILSSLPKTWIFDVDGTLVVHNGHLRSQGDEMLLGVKEVFSRISPKDTVILLTARKETSRPQLESFLHAHGIRYDKILFNMPVGERILVNDKKPSGLLTAYAINKDRNASLNLNIIIDQSL